MLPKNVAPTGAQRPRERMSGYLRWVLAEELCECHACDQPKGEGVGSDTAGGGQAQRLEAEEELGEIQSDLLAMHRHKADLESRLEASELRNLEKETEVQTLKMKEDILLAELQQARNGAAEAGAEAERAKNIHEYTASPNPCACILPSIRGRSERRGVAQARQDTTVLLPSKTSIFPHPNLIDDI